MVIPTLQAAAWLPRLVRALGEQTLAPDEIIVVDSASTDGTPQVASEAGCRVLSIERQRFDHGGARNRGVEAARGTVVVFLSQDALPADESFLERLTRLVRSGEVAAAFARQLPRVGATPSEVFAQGFNYPAVSRVRTWADATRDGIRAVFFSDSGSAFNRRMLRLVGGFPAPVATNEDMLVAARLMRAGFATAYESTACIIHSHRYSLGQLFGRYFDQGATMARHQELLRGIPIRGEGARFVRTQLRWALGKRSPALVIRVLGEVWVKAAGFGLGRLEQRLPRCVKVRLGMHSMYWRVHG